MAIKVLIEGDNHLGEGPLWDVRERKVCGIDSAHSVGMSGGALLLTALSTLLSASLPPEAARNTVYGALVLAAVVALRERSPP
jgi:hypothetical protein